MKATDLCGQAVTITDNITIEQNLAAQQRGRLTYVEGLGIMPLDLYFQAHAQNRIVDAYHAYQASRHHQEEQP
jgi:hypothetical protein